MRLSSTVHAAHTGITCVSCHLQTDTWHSGAELHLLSTSALQAAARGSEHTSGTSTRETGSVQDGPRATSADLSASASIPVSQAHHPDSHTSGVSLCSYDTLPVPMSCPFAIVRGANTYDACSCLNAFFAVLAVNGSACGEHRKCHVRQGMKLLLSSLHADVCCWVTASSPECRMRLRQIQEP